MENQEKIVIKLEELPPRAEKLSPDEVSRVFGGGSVLAGTSGASGSSCDNDCGCISNRCIIEPGESIGFCA